MIMPEGHWLEMGENLITFDLHNGMQKYNKAARCQFFQNIAKAKAF
jgi:hypothetical protein